MSESKPFAILLCRFNDDQTYLNLDRNETAAMFVDFGSASVLSYWRDVSYGGMLLSNSQVFGWLTIDHPQSAYTGSGANPAGREQLVTWARKAAETSGIDLSPFYGVAVYMSTGTDLWGSTGRVVCDIDATESAILQEFGHGFGLLLHSRATSQPGDYTDPYCTMSAMTFGGNDPTFFDRFGETGPGLSASYVDAAGWLTPDRRAALASDGTRPKVTKLVLARLGDWSPVHPQAAVFDLSSPYSATYYVQFRSGGWDRGFLPRLVVHQLRQDGYSYYVGDLGVVDRDGNPTPGRVWSDPEFDLAVRLDRVLEAGAAVEITVGSRAVGRSLSVSSIARETLGLTGGFSVRDQIMQPGSVSLRASLLTLLDR